MTIPNSVTYIGSGAFLNCPGLTSVTIPNSVTYIDSDAFNGCSGLTSLVVGENNPSYSSVENVLFNKDKTKLIYCAGGKSGGYSIPNSVTNIGDDAFFGCSGLTSVTIPNSVTRIGSYAFSRCSGLTSVTIPNSVTSIWSYAFHNVNNIVYHGSAEGSPWGAKSVNGYVEGFLVYKDESKKELLGCSSVATGDLTIPNSVTSIGDNAFYNCSGLTSVTIPNSVTSIGRSAFQNCIYEA